MTKRNFLYILYFLFTEIYIVQAQTVIGDVDNDVVAAAIDNSAELKIFASGNNKGILIPTLTTIDMNGIVNPATGLILFNTTQNEFMYYNAVEWRPITYIESVSSNSKIGIYEGETKLYTIGNILIYLNNANNWRQISLGAGTITP